MPRTPVYLDHAASSPLQPRALEAMLPYLTQNYGNPSSLHRLGRQARRALDDARSAVAAVLGCRPNEVTFTGGGTESVNTALKGIAFAEKLAGVGNHIVTCAVEHDAVRHTCQYLEKFGFEVTILPVDRYGLVSPDQIAAAVNERTVLVSIMLANNEVGTIEPLAEIRQAVRERERALRRHVAIHTDAIQAAGTLDLNVDSLGVDALSLSSHKFGGPKGVGVLYLRRGLPFLPQMTGGGQERQRRAGTENVAGIVGMATALSLAAETRESSVLLYKRLSEQLIKGIPERIGGAHLQGHPYQRLPNNVHFTFDDVEGEELIKALDAAGIYASSGSACAAHRWEPSHVLLAMGLSLTEAVGSLRLSLGPTNTPSDVDRLLAVLPGIIAKLRTRRVVAGSTR